MKEIPLTQNKVAIVDDTDFEAVSKHKWCAVRRDGGLWYAVTTTGDQWVLMHQFLLATPKGMHTDHRDNNGLNNRRENLRIATASQNGGNRRLNRNNTSGFKGVSWIKKSKKWRATIWVHRRSRVLGHFGDKLDAARAYDDAARAAFGEFAKPNFS